MDESDTMTLKCEHRPRHPVLMHTIEHGEAWQGAAAWVAERSLNQDDAPPGYLAKKAKRDAKTQGETTVKTKTAKKPAAAKTLVQGSMMKKPVRAKATAAKKKPATRK
mmetsp:Transcript_26754/g.56730  ORF Transcript_26754/g.56730 Transcript_26754/m.56730 type:complete len:108 (+) Transcript_26754:3-326(+)